MSQASTKTVPTIAEAGQPARASEQEGSSRGLLSVVFSIAACGFALLALLVVNVSEPSSSGSVATASEPIAVSLSEFAIAPKEISAPAGAVRLTVTNKGSQVHNFSVPALGKKTKDLQAGESQTLDLGELAAGRTLDVLCEIPGHGDSGMKGTLTVTAAGGAAATDTASSGGSGSGDMAGMDHSTMSATDYAAMDKRMAEGMAKGLDTFTKGGSTKGVGNQPLTPTVGADGTKEFTLEAAIIDWEVAPGKTVKAWAYNNMVPGPWIRTEPGDKVKITITNKLPVTTDIHFHGISTPFDMDGVAPLTQPAIKSGETFSYEWTNVDHPELGMYHAHDHGQTAVVNGMFAVFQVGDVPLPTGRTIGGRAVPADLKVTQELPMVLNDAGTIGLSLNGKSYPATAPVAAKPGDALLVHYYNEGLLSHPMHLHHLPGLVVAKDGFPLDEPYWADTINIAPGERYSVLVLPTNNDIGVWAWHCHILNHAENDDGLFGMVTALIIEDPNKPKS